MDETKNEQPTSGEAAARERGIPELVKRAILSGIGAVFMTEEGIRAYLGEMKLPKEAAQFVIGQVARTKEEMLRVITDEIRSFLDNTQLDDVLRQVLTNISLEISTKVRFVDESGNYQPRARSRLRVDSKRKKRSRKKSKGTAKQKESDEAKAGEPADAAADRTDDPK